LNKLSAQKQKALWGTTISRKSLSRQARNNNQNFKTLKAKQKQSIIAKTPCLSRDKVFYFALKTN